MGVVSVAAPDEQNARAKFIDLHPNAYSYWCAKGTCSFAADICLALQLIKISDLENDFINPHDATNSINAWVVRMCEAQAEPLHDVSRRCAS